MNLLFINGKYEDVMEVMDFIQNEAQFETKYPRDCVLLYTAAAYKLVDIPLFSVFVSNH